MATSLYELSVASYLQTLDAMDAILEKGRAFCEARDIALEELVETRLHPDMLPFRFQVVSVAHHSLGAIKGLQAGRFGPPSYAEDTDYAGLQQLLAEARTQLRQCSPQQIAELEGSTLEFKAGSFALRFQAEDFVLSFSLPNFYFHASTAYDILRLKGVPLGKMDFLGRLRAQSN